MDSSDSSDEEAMLLIGIVVASEKDKRQKNMWVRDYLKKRDGSGAFQLVQEIAMFHKEMFHRYMRMSPSAFEELLSLVATKITKKNKLQNTNSSRATFKPDHSPPCNRRIASVA